MTSVSLVLGSGGARGYAHIGVIEVLEARGYHISCIAGSSMGALVGGLYAAGALDAYREWVMGLSRLQILRLLDLTFGLGTIRGDRLFQKITDLAGDPGIETLRIPFTAVATDIIHHKEVWFQRGSLQAAIRASVAVPGVFAPIVDAHRVLVDGGVLNPLPIIPVVAARSDLIIAVDLNSSPAMPEVQLPRALSLIPTVPDSVAMASILKKNGEKNYENKFKLDSNLDVLMCSLEVMQGALSQYKIAGYSPDVLMNIPTETCRFHDFHRAREVIEVGRKVANESLDALEERARKE
ncbi:patatin-like phospholipase family protein [Neptunomonas antarctica]|uniref:NTE family protein n=1 Tax=Neptunomonas antarctica TaxID=619304 RepID=A0A1N7K9W9_9GAMM|nr:patatin-like phospholipase family protein [Neptunomonas antarctica]SIS58254.1 NTE family protein [Neptunomonas antarctica]